MFRIYNLQELKRLTALLLAFEQRGENFPLDIFRTEDKISGFPYGENDLVRFAHTTDDGQTEVTTDRGENLRESVRRQSEVFFSDYRYQMLSLRRQKD